ncbi:HupE/UreJ family protein [Jiella sp. MQZ9-1]|uniref:HupE/UreJ family protein n=1 Tax=Jiella flava TaxID=2816857 RepID=A0A939G3B6_9HYPH|nr:HupE/UreJ family protein [Jiella flava]MBO0664472.1 HupE/UreJ family protein [Jiella flava]MCD2473108.1 HupE/UreJ family protein [Jiella flava]
MPKRTLLAFAALLATPLPAFAHFNPAEHGSLLAGLSHPLTGLDHIVVMLLVGVWAATFRGAGRLVIPAAFLVMMLAGFALAMAGVSLPFVEPTILASVVAIGLLVALAVRVPSLAAVAIVGIFAVFHGHAHGSELGAAGALSFACGFAAATAALHGAGLWLGSQAVRHARPIAIRAVGWAGAATGLLLFAA